MVSAWYISDEDAKSEAEKRSQRHLNPPEYLTLEEVRRRTGVLYEWVDVDKYRTEDQLSEICVQKGYHSSDVLDIHPNRLDNYDQNVKNFYTEHLHSEEEVRLVLDGSGYFDVRDVDNRWVRIAVQKGDLLTLPAGSYHRFTLDNEHNWIRLYRLFGTEQWKAFYRPADDHPSRIQFLREAVKGF